MRRLYHIAMIVLFTGLSGMSASNAGNPPPARRVDLAIAAMPDITGGTDYRMEGHYGRTIQAILGELDISLAWNLASPDHAYRGFYRGRFDCVTPDSASVYPPNSGYIDSLPLTTITWLAISRPGSTVITRPGELHGKRVGLPYEVDAMVNVVPAAGPAYSINSDSYQLLRMLENERLDAVVLTGSEFRVLRQQRTTFAQFSIDESQPLATNPEGFMCHDNHRGRSLRDALDRAIKKLGPDKIRSLMQATN